MSAIALKTNLGNRDRLWFKLGAFSLLAGTILLTILSFVHPHQADPNNNPAVFAEYAADPDWIATHLGQFFASFLVLIVATFSIYRSLASENENIANWARIGMITAGLAMAVFAVDQGLDGIALKRAVDAWAHAPAASKEIYLGTAEGIRWLEYGLNGMYNILQGMSVLFFSIGAVMSSVYPQWLGWLGGIASGLARIVVGLATMTSGFSALVGAIGMIAFLGGTLWVFALTYFLWTLPGQQN